MALVTEPDIYAPSIDEMGNYIDQIPSFNILKHGLYCPCGTRKDKVYDTSAKISTHIKTKGHNKWLSQLNINRANYYVECEKLKETVMNQRRLIAQQEKQINDKELTITYLTKQVNSLSIVNKCPTGNLLDLS
jgi:hypothetical protein